MYNILTLNKIAQTGLEKLESGKYSITEQNDNPDAILLRSFNLHEYDIKPSVLAIGRAGAGFNNIPVDQCAKKGIVVFNTPGANANAVKELAIAGLLISSRDIIGGIKWVEQLESDSIAKDVEKGKSAFGGPEISGKVLGVVGLGAIGVIVANAAISLGMEVYGYDPYMSIGAAWGLSRHVKKAESLNEIYRNSDYITLHMPSNDKTNKTINEDAINSMKDNVRIINFSRAELVDTSALKAGIDSGKIAKYVCDFPNNDLKVYKNVICLPHLGSSTPESEDNCAVMAVREVKDYLENGNIANSVNLPNVSMERQSESRITVIHENKPNMISQISNEIAKEGVNIENLVNGSKGNYAYTIIDTSSSDLDEIKNKISGIDGVIRVRAIV